MQPRRARLLVVVPLLLGLCSSAVLGRAMAILSYEDLIATSDMVAIIEPLENTLAQDLFFAGYGHSPDDFVATDTRFKIHAVLKGDRGTANELTVLHFDYSKNVSGVANGALFIRFSVGPLQYEKRAVKDGKVVGGITAYQQEPVWLAFLKRRNDGRFQPVTNQYDSARSFRELHQSSFFFTSP